MVDLKTKLIDFPVPFPIRKKMREKLLIKDEIYSIIRGVVDHELSELEMAASKGLFIAEKVYVKPQIYSLQQKK